MMVKAYGKPSSEPAAAGQAPVFETNVPYDGLNSEINA